MRLIVAAVGRLKDGAEREVFAKYRDRFEASAKRLGFAPVRWQEVMESRAGTATLRKAEEAAALFKMTRETQHIIALDERGKMLSSEGFARLLAKMRDDGAKAAAIVIGGADGLGADLLQAAQHKLSLGAMTLPHGLARIVLAEQLYRAATILSGHPYHRGAP
jgi:23S rRNA (pseudouridine1915-N3)-methyltransferase